MKMRTKKFICMILSALLICGVLPLNAFATAYVSLSLLYLDNLKVNVSLNLNAAIQFSPPDGMNFADNITPEDFACFDLPEGLSAGSPVRLSGKLVYVPITGTLKKPMPNTEITTSESLPARNFREATAPVPLGEVWLTVAKGDLNVYNFKLSNNKVLYDGSPKPVTVTVKSGDTYNDGAITVSYTGVSGTTYAKSTEVPTEAGTYEVTIHVAEGTSYNETIDDLNLGTLTIMSAIQPLVFADSADFDIPAMKVGVPITPINVSVNVSGGEARSSGSAPYTYTADDLPRGIVIDEDTGIISGTPTMESPDGTAKIYVEDYASPPVKESIDISFGAISGTLPLCSLNGTNYDTIGDAIAALSADNQTITLLRDYAPFNTLTLDAPRPFTLDLSQHEISNGGDFIDTVDVRSGHVTIKNGSIINHNLLSLKVTSNGSATLDGLTVTATSGNATAAFVNTTGTVSVLSGSYVGNDESFYVKSGTLTITAGDFQSGASGKGCMKTTGSGLIALAPGSTSNIDPFVNNPAALILTITAGIPPLAFTDSAAYDIPAMTIDAPITSIDVSGGVSGGTAPYDFTATGLPDGLVISASGTITGTPTATGAAGTATITVTDAALDTASITINYGAIRAAASIYNTSDIVAINAMIDANGLLAAAAPEDGSSVPANWGFATWSTDTTNKRVTRLTLPSRSLTGALDLRGLTELTYLECTYNQLTALDVSGLTELTRLFCGGNQLTALDLRGLTKLAALDCGTNQLTELDVSSLTELASLSCGFNQLTELDTSGLKKLTELWCGVNRLTALDLRGLTELTTLFCEDNQLAALNVSDLTKLTILACGMNRLTALDVSDLTKLTQLYCDDNQLTALDLRGLTELTQLYCDDNQLTVLDVSGITELIALNCTHNWMSNTSDVIGYSGSWDNGAFTFTPQYTPTAVTYTAVQTGGASGTADSTGIVLTFSQSVTGLTANNVSITNGSGTVTKGALSGSGTTWTIALTDVAAEGNVTVNVADFNAFDVTTAPQTVAVYKANSPASYTITFNANGGSASPTSAQTGADGKLTTLPTPTRSGSYSFDGWYTAQSGGTQVTTAKVFTANTEIFAHWTYTGGNSGSSGSSGSGSSTVQAPPTTAVSGDTVNPNPATTGGTTTVTVKPDELSKAADNAVKDAKASGDAMVAIDFTAPADSATTQVTLPKAGMTGLAGKEVALTISDGKATLNINQSALSTINAQAMGDVIISVSQVPESELTQAQKEAVAGRPVFDFSITSGNAKITDFGGGTVGVTVPYPLAAGENANAVVVYYLGADGKLQMIENGVYDPETKTVNFTTNHFSLYVLGYNPVAFTDVSDTYWGKDAIEKAAARGLVAGVGNDLYEPDRSVTRAEFVQMIENLLKLPEAKTGTAEYADVASGAWYYDAVMNARSAGLLDKFTGDFKPDQAITREEMSAILASALKQKEIVTGTYAINLKDTYGDFDKMNEGYLDDIMIVTISRLMQGVGGGQFDPQGLTTRAQAATVQIRLLEMLNP